jgi:hypothetical protein
MGCQSARNKNVNRDPGDLQKTAFAQSEYVTLTWQGKTLGWGPQASSDSRHKALVEEPQSMEEQEAHTMDWAVVGPSAAAVRLAMAVVVVVAPLQRVENMVLSSEAALWLAVVEVKVLSSEAALWLAVVEVKVAALHRSLVPILVLALWLAKSSKGFAWLAMPSRGSIRGSYDNG